MGVATVGLITFVLLHERSLFWSVDFAALLAAIVFLALVALLLTDVGVQLEMRLPRQFRTLGSGYGLVRALKAALAKIDAVRARREAGELTAEQAEAEEAKLFDAMSRYFTDKRWKEVHNLKNKGYPDDAKTLAQNIRDTHQM